VRFYHRGYCQVDGSKPNQALAAALKGYPEGVKGQKENCGWLGNVVATAMGPTHPGIEEGSKESYELEATSTLLDIDLAHFREIIDYLVWLPPQPSSAEFAANPPDWYKSLGRQMFVI
jgi:hypothetical protein